MYKTVAIVAFNGPLFFGTTLTVKESVLGYPPLLFTP
jgi:hypothetical protein